MLLSLICHFLQKYVKNKQKEYTKIKREITMLQILVLCLALCMDEFVASIAYGADGISINWKETGVMNGICSACLGAALCFGTALTAVVPENLTKAICFTSLFILGAIRLADSLIKNYINHHYEVRKDIHFSFSQLQFIISIYGNPTAADSDHSQTLSMKETVFLAFAMSIDSLVAGTFAAFLKVHILPTMLAAFLIGVAAMGLGQLLGRKIASRLSWNLSWLSGVLFIVLAFSKLKG